MFHPPASSVSSGDREADRLDACSAPPLYLVALCARKPLLAATGFLYRAGKRLFLLTAWQVLAGRDPRTGRPLDQHGRLPDALRVLHHDAVASDRWNLVEYPLYQSSSFEPLWIAHPRGAEVDVAAIEMDMPLDARAFAVNDQLDDEPSDGIHLARNLFILGFPSGLPDVGALPIWTRATAASEPSSDLVSGLPSFLVDIAGGPRRAGLAGAPVISRVRSGGRMRTRFVGIYVPTDGSTLGRVFSPQVIEEIIVDGGR